MMYNNYFAETKDLNIQNTECSQGCLDYTLNQNCTTSAFLEEGLEMTELNFLVL